MRSLVWFKGNDLRILDNPALYHAIKTATATSSAVHALAILSPIDETSHNRSNIQMDFLLRNLDLLSSKLWSQHRIPLVVKIAESRPAVLKIMLETCIRLSIQHVFFHNQYEVDETRRDIKVQDLLEGMGVKVSRFDSTVVVNPATLVPKSSGKPYSVYTPFRKAWIEHVKSHHYLLKEYNPPPSWKNTEVVQEPDKVPVSLAGFELTDERREKMISLYPAGEEVALDTLKKYVQDKLVDYQRDRDFLNMDGTSRLSPYLALGMSSQIH
jgi:deoxyribodipyrimidine photo-lyase